MATPVPLPLPRVGPPAPPAALPVPVVVGGRPLTVRIVDAGLACCAVEVMAALCAMGPEPGAPPAPQDGVPIDVLVVSGTCTTAMAPALQSLHASLGAPRVMAFGACTASGGPYWDSYSVAAGIGHLLPVDVVVPGCPPAPEALLEGLRLLVERQP